MRGGSGDHIWPAVSDYNWVTGQTVSLQSPVVVRDMSDKQPQFRIGNEYEEPIEDW